MDAIDRRRVFPLLRLPKDVQKNVLRAMEMLVLLTYSLCSNATKHQTAVLLKSLLPGARYITLTFSRCYSLTIYSRCRPIELRFVSHSRNQDDRVLQNMSLDKVEASWRDITLEEDERQECTWVMPKFTARDWFDHFLSIFDQLKIDIMKFREPRFDPNSIDETLKGIKIEGIDIGQDIPNEYSRHVLKQFWYAATVVLSINPFETITQTRGLLAQNLRTIRLWEEFQFTLDDLLVTNSRSIELCQSRLTEKDINRFFKLWQLGSNPRLLGLTLIFINRPNTFDRAAVLNGLRSLKLADSEVFNFYRRQDGRRGSIHFHEDVGSVIDFLVERQI